MKAKLWPNGIGWDIGLSEVRNCGKFLRAFVPVNPETGIHISTGKKFSTDRHKRMDFPLGSDPVLCVKKCREQGTIFYDK